MKRLLQIILLFPAFSMAQYTGLQFDGSGDYIKTSYNGVSGSGSRTVQCWFKSFSASAQRFFVDMGVTSGGNGARFSFKINGSTNVARIEIGGGGIDGTTNIANNAWHHLTVVYDNAASSNKYKIYVDGVLDVQGDIAIALNTSATSANPMTIGIRTDLSSITTLSGGLDDVRIWNIPLSAAAIAASFNKELCGTPPGLVAYYKMNEGIASSNNTAITSLIDEVSPSNVNTLFGFTLTGNSSNYNTNILALVNNTVTQTVSSCSNYNWPQTGQTYTNAGMYYDTVYLYVGCDSVYILNLSFTSISGPTISVTNCNNYTWSQNGQTYAASGIYNDTVPSSSGCDSVVQLALTITPIPLTSINVDACNSYLWSVNNQTYTSSGTYTGIVTTAAGCDSTVELTLTLFSDSNTITYNGATLQVGVSTGATYQWLNCSNNTLILGATNQTYTVPGGVGSYACVTTTSSCTDTTDCFNFSNIGFDELSKNEFSIYPNPTNGKFTIESSGSQLIHTIIISDIQGKQIASSTIESNSYTADLSNVDSGVYYVSIISENGQKQNYRVVKN
ncbi:T9SS type A sorting domain-containing protein [Crocinitomicaceae bacterium]|nr:T9SS type A sorting domain-containing protein [Crocinitomicaceae bacterium]